MSLTEFQIVTVDSGGIRNVSKKFLSQKKGVLSKKSIKKYRGKKENLQ